MKAIQANSKAKTKIMPKPWCGFTSISKSKLTSKGTLSTKIVKNQLKVMRPMSILETQKSTERERNELIIFQSITNYCVFGSH